MIDIQELARSKGLKDVRLDIGAGGYSSDDKFISIDAYTEADINALMWELPIEDESVDVIFASQCLEHISKFAVVPTLKEWLRVLKKGGQVQFNVPDLEWSCWWWLTHQTVEWDLDIIYGNQKHPGEYHKTGFTPRIIRTYINACGGFGIHKIEYFGGDVTDLVFDGENGMGGTVNGRCINVELIKL